MCSHIEEMLYFNLKTKHGSYDDDKITNLIYFFLKVKSFKFNL